MREKNNANPSKKGFFLKNLTWYEHLMAGWPLILIFAGGAIGGACGGAAYFFNTKLFNSQLSKALKYTYSFLIGIGSVILYFIIALFLFSILPLKQE